MDQEIKPILPLTHPGVLEPCRPVTLTNDPHEFSGHSTGACRLPSEAFLSIDRDVQTEGKGLSASIRKETPKISQVAKADDVEIPKQIWDNKILAYFPHLWTDTKVLLVPQALEIL